MAVFNTNAPSSFNYSVLVSEAGDAVANFDPTVLENSFGAQLSATTALPTLVSGPLSLGGSWTYTGTNLLPFFFAIAGSGTIQTISLVNADASSSMLITGPVGFTASVSVITGGSGAITHIQYDSPTFDLNFVGSIPVTGSTITVKQIDLVDTLNDVEFHFTGSMSLNADTGAVSGTVNSFFIEVDGQHIAASGLSLSANTFMTADTFTVIHTLLSGADTLTADEANVRLEGLGGNDTYIYNVGAGPDGLTWVDETPSGGVDTLKTAFNHTLEVNVENGTLLPGGTSLTGNHLANALTGNSGDNTLDGARGADILIGGAGNDTYIVDLQRVGTVVSLQDMVTEGLNAGNDTLVVRASPQDTITFAIEQHVGEETFTRVADAGNPIVGSWVVTGATGGGTGVLTLLSDGSFTFGQDGNDSLNPGVDGSETGTYTWDAESHAFSFAFATDSNEGFGLSGLTISSATVGGNTLTFDGGASGTKVTSTTSSLVGGWSEGSGDELTTVAFLNDGTYMMVHANGGMGFEHAGFIWTPASGGFIINVSVFQGGLGAGGLEYPIIDSMTMDLGVPASSTYNVVLPANVENLDLSLAGSTNVNGTGNALNNVLTGSDGNNVLDGGLGNDTYFGSLGNDTYLISQVGDIVDDAPDGGTDTVKVGATGNPAYLNISGMPGLENVVFTGTAGVAITGNAGDNSLTGGAGNDAIDGGAGNDVMTGGAGNDVYTVDSSGDVVNDSAGTGDTVMVNVDAYILGTGVENLMLGDDDSIVSGSGNALANVLTANGNEPALTGGAGNDTFIFQASLGSVVEGSGVGSGIDLVKTAFDYTLDANVENATVLGGSGVELTGNDLANLLTGSTGNDTLIGAGGNDSLVGGAGNDQYDVNLVKPATTVLLQDMVTDTAGTDTLVVHSDGGLVLPATGFTLTLAATLENVDISDVSQNINVTGNAANNILTGGSGNNILDGGLGNDSYVGSDGNDTYLISQAGDAVTGADGGIDTVKVGATGNTAFLNLSDKGELENVIFTGTAGVAITGNDSDNSLTGGAGNDSIDGGAGNDLMAGGGGNDVYTVDSLGDFVSDSAGTGDTVIANVNGYSLGTGVENLILGDDALITSGAGNALNNTLTTNAFNPILNGGAGNDTYIFQASLGHVGEAPGAGTDLVKTAFNYELEANVENAMVLGSAGVMLIGNGQANVLTGGSGNDILAGSAGNDTLIGGAGDDRYDVLLVKPATTVVLEDMITDTSGNDTLRVYASGGLTLPVAGYTLMLAASLENVDLGPTGALDINVTGNAANNAIDGNEGNNILDGGLGNDTYYGAGGNDTYLISQAGDVVAGSSDAGIDIVKVGATGNATYLDLSDKGWLENVVFTGTVGVHITGNELSNRLTGAGGADTIDGGLGNDVMIGAGGNDTYVVDSGGDSITDSAGIDTVLAGVSFTLTAGLENLTLTGTDSIDGTGNALANKLIGNDVDNFLFGGGGLDSMTGGLGNDTFVIDHAVAGNVISIQDFVDGQDHIALDANGVAGFAAMFSGEALAPAQFVVGTAATAVTAQLIYTESTGALYYDADGTGTMAKVQIAMVVDHPTLGTEDFTLIPAT